MHLIQRLCPWVMIGISKVKFTTNIYNRYCVASHPVESINMGPCTSLRLLPTGHPSTTEGRTARLDPFRSETARLPIPSENT